MLSIFFIFIAGFTSSLSEPLLLFLVGMFLILLSSFARRLMKRAIKSAENIHETIAGRRTKEAK